MGEWSRLIGEYGEEIVHNFLQIIGWGTAQKAVTIPCLKTAHNKQTHGIDFLYSSVSKLIDRTLENKLISVKYSSKPYPQHSTSLFKNHLKDLLHSIDCFHLSEVRTSINQRFTGVDQTNDIGVLFWLNNTDENENVIEKVSHARDDFKDVAYDSVYLVDNHRASFIYTSISHLKSKFPSCEIDFFYPSTGKNINPFEKNFSGKALPVQYINSSILPIRVEYNNQITFAVSVIDGFSESYLRRVIGLSQELSSTLVNNILILFPDYNRMEHSNIVQTAKSSFTDEKLVQIIEVESFNDTFRS